MATVEDLANYYANLLIIQYASKEKAVATIKGNATILAIDNIEFDVSAGFDLNTAVGKQLDIIGKWVGIDRSYKGGLIPENVFGMVRYGQDRNGTGQRGFKRYGEDKAGFFLTYEDTAGENLLTDEDYRILLKLQIVSNNSECTHKSIDEQLYQFFGDTVIASTANQMDITYFINVDNRAGLISVILEKNALPVPLAVKVKAITYFNEPYFGFVRYGTDVISGTLKTGFKRYGEDRAGRTLVYGN
ncbi:MAG: DUF2612 domain-containing protein [Flavobacterium sp.]